MIRLKTLALLTLVLVGAAVPMAAAGASAQSAGSDEITNETESVIHQFDGGGALRSVAYRDGATFVTLKARDSDSQRFAVSEAVQSGPFAYEEVRVPQGETLTVEIPARQATISVVTDSDSAGGYTYSGSAGPPVTTGQPTDKLLQITGISGILGSILSLATVSGHIKRRHENTYKELFSDERKSIERDAFEGWRDRLVAWAKDRGDSKISTVTGVAVLAYVAAVVAGVVAPPGELWISLSDGQRLIVATTIAATLVALFPMYYLADRLYNPDRDFVLDLDSKDVYKSKSGDKSGTVAAYSAPPEQVAEMDVDGSMTNIGTPGGRAHLVRGFDPEENSASGNPPEMDNDRLASIHAVHIKKNRGVLQDLALIGKDLIGGMTSFRVIADTKAMKDMDQGLRDTVSAGQDSLDDVLEQAVEGTRYEGAYSDPEELQGEFESVLDSAADPDDEEVTNDPDTDPETNGADQ